MVFWGNSDFFLLRFLKIIEAAPGFQLFATQTLFGSTLSTREQAGMRVLLSVLFEETCFCLAELGELCSDPKTLSVAQIELQAVDEADYLEAYRQ